MSDRTSVGRGGAGNIVDKAKSPSIEPRDLETPTLKNSVVTTGRGGNGNMAKNNDPAETRALQDVEPVTRQEGGTHFIGRGGDGNVFKPKPEHPKQDQPTDKVAAPEPARSDGAVPASSTPRDPAQAKKAERESLASKGKQWLFGKK